MAGDAMSTMPVAPDAIPSSMQQAPLADLLAVVFITSPVRSNPSTEMLERCLQSYVEGSGLEGCAKVIVSDGFTVAGAEQKEKPKSGRIPSDWVDPYAEYRDRIDALIAGVATPDDCIGGERPPKKVATMTFEKTKHLRMPHHVGFGGCCYCALRHVTAPYVLVLQHDRPLQRNFSSAAVVAAMEASAGAIKYVGLPTKASLARCHPDALESRCHLPTNVSKAVNPLVPEAAAAARIDLQVLLFWYDSAHFCRASHYRDFVFLKGRVPGGGGFPEDSFGQEFHSAICAAVASEFPCKAGLRPFQQCAAVAASAGSPSPVACDTAAAAVVVIGEVEESELQSRGGRGTKTWRDVHEDFGTYLLDDGKGPMVGHLRGRRYHDDAELIQRGWVGGKNGRSGTQVKLPVEKCGGYVFEEQGLEPGEEFMHAFDPLALGEEEDGTTANT